jgi:hypothetical protein
LVENNQCAVKIYRAAASGAQNVVQKPKLQSLEQIGAFRDVDNCPNSMLKGMLASGTDEVMLFSKANVHE